MRGVIRSIKVSLWFMVLAFPLMGIRVDNTVEPVAITWRFMNIVWLGTAIFILSFVWRGMLVRKGDLTPEEADLAWLFKLLENKKVSNAARALLYFGLGCVPFLVDWYEKHSLAKVSLVSLSFMAAGAVAAIINLAGRQGAAKARIAGITGSIARDNSKKLLLLCLALALMAYLPFGMNSYQVRVITQALIWVSLGLGLNIIVGQAGLLVLGYMAFYAVGAYTYGIFNYNFPMLGFWTLLPFGALLATVAGLALGFPVLRLRGDYLAIVTLGFGEIMYEILRNLTDITGGSNGIRNIPRPSFFGVKMGLNEGSIYVYFLALLLALISIVAVGRLRDSRLGRSLIALREDEVACETMGLDKIRIKLTAFALGACWAGLGGALFAAKESFINPEAFKFMESITILCVVVLGGLGSIWGVVLGAVVIVVLPEYLRAFSEYRMLIFGACLVLMMVFRPQGLITPKRKEWVINDPDLQGVRNGADEKSGGGAA